MSDCKHFRMIPETLVLCLSPSSNKRSWTQQAGPAAKGGSVPAYLPVELEKYVDASSAYATVRNLTEAAEKGQISLSAVAAYVRAVERGDKIRFSKTRQIPLAMKEMIEARRDLPPRQVVYMGWNARKWEWEDVEAWENNQSVLSEARAPAARRGVYLTRDRRVSRRKPKTEGRYVPKMSLDALCRFGISDGAKTCLALLMSIAGGESTITTYTSSIAAQLGRTARTVRNHFIALEEAGLITRSPGRDPNTVRITISSECRPEPYREPDHVKAYKLASRSANQMLRMLAYSVAEASMSVHRAEFGTESGRKGISAFNPESNILDASSSPAPERPGRKPGEIGPTTHSTLARGMSPPTLRRLHDASRKAVEQRLSPHRAQMAFQSEQNIHARVDPPLSRASLSATTAAKREL